MMFDIEIVLLKSLLKFSSDLRRPVLPVVPTKFISDYLPVGPSPKHTTNESRPIGLYCLCQLLMRRDSKVIGWFTDSKSIRFRIKNKLNGTVFSARKIILYSLR